ncbi:MAG: hypothetical protein B2I17_01820 [Thermoplasmatales archaeon B_DKE]|nr:MAG: hypothetical protein B2I17_01820 [Thermoplasmatales archaeon B_DKE]
MELVIRLFDVEVWSVITEMRDGGMRITGSIMHYSAPMCGTIYSIWVYSGILSHSSERRLKCISWQV